jgi:deoxyadenosine/deoxycytidine kinase
LERQKVVIVEGIIGAGKSSLSAELAESLGPETLALMEPDERNNANPYLGSFYQDPQRWAFTMQVHLLQARYKMHLQAQWYVLNKQGHSVLDRSYFGDTAFARLQLKTGAMSQAEFDTYQSIYHSMTASVLLPNFCVRLRVSPEIAAQRIQSRMEERSGRSCESTIDLDYLVSLDQEIDYMVDVLRDQGVTILELPWDEDRKTPEARYQAVKSLTDQINEKKVPDLFLDLHRRSI